VKKGKLIINNYDGGIFSIDQLKGVCQDLWIAGQETTSTTLTWGIAYLINRPEVQAKMHAELNEVIGGSDIIVTMASRPSMPYTNAVINVRKLGRINFNIFSNN
jgi:cytochrome P450